MLISALGPSCLKMRSNLLKWPVISGRDCICSALTGLLSVCIQVQRGGNPNVSEILAVRSLFSKAPLAMNTMSNNQIVSKTFFSFTPSLLHLFELICVYGWAETHQPPPLPDAPSPGLPDWSTSEQPRRGAVPAGPSPEPNGPSPAQWVGTQTGVSLCGFYFPKLKRFLRLMSDFLVAGLLCERDERWQSWYQSVSWVVVPVASGVICFKRYLDLRSCVLYFTE